MAHNFVADKRAAGSGDINLLKGSEKNPASCGSRSKREQLENAARPLKTVL
jgi:hypothetical protein